MKQCSIKDCEGKVRARGWCKIHYDRWRKRGTTDLVLNPETCTVADCDRPYSGRNLCRMHLQRLHRRGRVDLPTREEVFWSRVRKTEGCWLWIGKSRTHAYGQFASGPYQRTSAHRYSYELANGPVPEGLIVRHKCDNPPCVNPDHLELGTVQDNSDDMVKRNRQARLPGEKHPHAKLTNEQVILIRRLVDRKVPYSQIQEVVNVGFTTISNIGRRRTWTHIPENYV